MMYLINYPGNKLAQHMLVWMVHFVVVVVVVVVVQCNRTRQHFIFGQNSTVTKPRPMQPVYIPNPTCSWGGIGDYHPEEANTRVDI